MRISLGLHLGAGGIYNPLPTDIAGLVAWHRADDAASSGGNVTTIADHRGSGVTLTATGTVPLNATDTTYGGSIVTMGPFTGAAVLKSGLFGGGATGQPLTIYEICDTGGGASESIFDGNPTAGGARVVLRGARNALGVYAGTAFVDSLGAMSLSGYSVSQMARLALVCTVVNGASSQMYVDHMDTAVYGGVTPGVNGVSAISVGNDYVGSTPSGGKVVETIVYTGSHTTAQRNRIKAYAYRRLSAALACAQVVCDGNSLTYGYGLAVPATQGYPAQLQTLLGATTYVRNFGVSAIQTDAMVTNYPTRIAPFLDTRRAKNILVVWEGGNHIKLGGVSAATAWASLVSYMQLARASGWEIVLCNVGARGDIAGATETERDALNVLIAAGWATYADAFVDIDADVNLSNPADLTYFQADTIHYTQAGQAVVAGLIDTAVSSLL